MRNRSHLLGTSVLWISIVAGGAVVGSACGGNGGASADANPGTIFPEKPECSTVPITPRMGQHQMVISKLEIGSTEDGFDLDHDGDPDNKLSAVGSLARSAIEDAFDTFTIIIPMEFFDFPTNTPDDCVKFAFYLGQYQHDDDADGDKTADDGGDCNDHDLAINDDAAEVPANGKDDNCDGNADETVQTVMTDGGTETVVVLSTDTSDADADGVTIADGDCDDTNAMVMGPSVAETCGDGFDNDCDGNADFGVDAIGTPDCTPYDETPDALDLDPLSFNMDGSAVIVFKSGATVMNPGGTGMLLNAGPSLFSVKVPVTDDINLDLRISGATIEANVITVGDDLGILNGRLGGVLDAHTLDTIRGLDVSDINLKPEDSLLDAIFANILGTILGLQSDANGCKQPDIDVDLDGLESFCDSDPLDEINNVDVCIDGDGQEYHDEVDAMGVVTKHCTEVTKPDGTYRFLDGISIELNFKTVPTILN